MTPALLLVAMMGVVDTTYHLDWKEWTRPDGAHCTAGTNGGPFGDESCASLRALESDTIGYWLSGRDTIPVMRKR